MKISRLRGLLLYEYAGIVFNGKTRGLSVSLVRPQWWTFAVRRHARMREYLLGPVALILYYVQWRAD